MWRTSETVLSFIMGIGFCMTFLGFDMKNFIEEGIIHQIADQYPGRMDPHAGYYGLGISYATFTIGTLITPAIVQWIGSRFSLFFSSCVFTLYMAGFVVLNTWVYYIISAAMGAACALIWTAQGVYICQFTSKEKAVRNSGIVWSVNCFSFVFGAALLFILFKYTDNMVLSEMVVTYVFGGFFISSLLGNIAFLLLPTQPQLHSMKLSLVSCITKNFHIMKDRRMLLHVIPFFNLGVYTSYMLGIYPTCMLFTEKLRSTTGNQMMAYYAIAVGLGEILSGIAIGQYSSRVKGEQLLPLVAVALPLHVAGYVLTYFFFHENSKFEVTSESGVFDPSLTVALMIAFMMAAGDICWNTIRGAYLTTNFTDDRSQVFAMSKFFQSLASCATYLVGKTINLYQQLFVNIVLSILTAVAYYMLINGAKVHKTDVEISKEYEEDKNTDKGVSNILKNKLMFEDSLGKPDLEIMA